MKEQAAKTKLCRHCRSEMDKKAKVCPTCHKKQGVSTGCIIGLVLLVIVVLIPVFIIGSCSKAVDDAIKEDNKKADSKTISADEVIFDENGLKITYKGIEAGTLNVSTDIKLCFENDSEKSYSVTVEDFSVDGYSIKAGLYFKDIAAGKSANDSIEILDSYLEENGLSTDLIKEAELKFHFTNSDDFTDSFSTDTITIKLR